MTTTTNCDKFYTYLEWLERVFRPDKSIQVVKKGEDDMKVYTAKAANTIRKGQMCVVIKDADGNYFVSSVNEKQKPKKVSNVQKDSNNS